MTLPRNPGLVRVNIALIGKATAQLTIDIAAWASEYGVEPTAAAVAADVRVYYAPETVKAAILAALVPAHLSGTVAVSA